VALATVEDPQTLSSSEEAQDSSQLASFRAGVKAGHVDGKLRFGK